MLLLCSGRLPNKPRILYLDQDAHLLSGAADLELVAMLEFEKYAQPAASVIAKPCSLEASIVVVPVYVELEV